MTRNIKTLFAEVPAGKQFTGREFDVFSTTAMIIEIDVHMGSELKSWSISKIVNRGLLGSDSDGFIIRQSGASGVASATNDTDVVMVGDDIHTFVVKGDRIALITTGASSLMRCAIYYEVI